MKIRVGFVSNSSSSSFIIRPPKEGYKIKDFGDLLKKYIYDRYHDSHEKFTIIDPNTIKWKKVAVTKKLIEQHWQKWLSEAKVNKDEEYSFLPANDNDIISEYDIYVCSSETPNIIDREIVAMLWPDDLELREMNKYKNKDNFSLFDFALNIQVSHF